MHAVFAKIEADQAKLPPPKDDRERLERMYDLDQGGREVFEKIDFSVLPEAEREPATAAAYDEIYAHDLADQKALKEIIERDGWITKAKFGEQASTAAWAIVQHAINDPDLMRSTVALLGPLVAKGEVSGPQYATMYDRVALFIDHKPQRYGSQLVCQDGVLRPGNIEDPEHIDERRKSIGFTQTEADYLKSFPPGACS